MQYFRPELLEDALQLRAAHPVTVLAGGTDVYPAKASREAWGNTEVSDILDISRLSECRGISDRGNHYRIGALTTWTDLLRTELPSYFDALKQAAREIGGVQIQNRGTLAGNLCNASPAADGVPVLLTLDAGIELSSRTGTRTLPLQQFITGYRKTACATDEILTAITVPKCSVPARSRFLKLGTRRYLVISIVMVSGVLETDSDGRIASIRLAVGSCSPVAQRLTQLEQRLQGEKVEQKLGDQVSSADLTVLAPIDDCRATGSYRGDATIVLIRRLLHELCDS